MLGAVLQRVHDVAQRRERLVDVLRLLEPVARDLRPREPLRPGEVDQTERARLGRERRAVLARQVQKHERMGPAALDVHARGANLAVGVAFVQRGAHVAPVQYAARAHVGFVLDDDDAVGVQQVAHLVVVDLDHADAQLVAIRHAPRVRERKHLLQGAGDHAVQLVRLLVTTRGAGRRAEHRERLAGARLAVRHDARVEAVAKRRHERRHVVVHVALRALGPKHAVKVEFFGVFFDQHAVGPRQQQRHRFFVLL